MMPKKTTLVHSDLIVADDYPDKAFLRDVDLVPGMFTDWDLMPGPGSVQQRAVQMATDAGWTVTEGSNWHAETTEQFGAGQTIRIERMNTAET